MSLSSLQLLTALAAGLDVPGVRGDVPRWVRLSVSRFIPDLREHLFLSLSGCSLSLSLSLFF